MAADELEAMAEEIAEHSKPCTSLAAEAIDLTISLLREMARRHPVVLQDCDIEAFILNELNPAKVMANKDRTSCYGLMGLLAKARAARSESLPSVSFSDFIRNETPEEKEKVYTEVMQRATERQGTVSLPHCRAPWASITREGTRWYCNTCGASERRSECKKENPK